MIDETELRKYFLTHAPKEIPDWFENVPPEYTGTPYPYSKDFGDEKDQKIIISWLNGRVPELRLSSILAGGELIYELPENLKEYEIQYNKHGDDWAAHRKLCEEKRYFDWCAHYANKMIKEIKDD